MLRLRLRELASQRGGFGSPRLDVLLRRGCPRVNHKPIDRLHTLERLQVQFRRRKRRKCSPDPMAIAVLTVRFSVGRWT